MTDNRMGGIALIVGSVFGIVTMSLHPSGHDMLVPGQLGPMAKLAIGVHALAIAGLPLSFLGALALTRRVESSNRMALSALVVYGFGLAAVMTAAAVSGFVAPGVMQEMGDASPSASEVWRVMLDYNHHINQAFARIFTVASSAAIVLWSISIVRSRALALGLGIYGVVLGPVIVLGLLSGHLKLDVHGMGAVIFSQSLWFIIAGLLLWRAKAA